jgi:hypothetical protein
MTWLIKRRPITIAISRYLKNSDFDRIYDFISSQIHSRPLCHPQQMAALMQVSRTPWGVFEYGTALLGVGEALKREIVGLVLGRSAASMGI